MKHTWSGSGLSVFVTGAGSGVGYAVARLLAARGHTVFGGVFDDRDAQALADGLGASVRPVRIDVRREPSVASAVEQVAAALCGKPLHALVNIAGISSNGPLADLSEAEFEQVLAVNVLGVHNATRGFLPMLADANGARILNMSSQSGVRTMPFTGVYSASKFALEALSSAMRMEFSPLGIEVAVVAPGIINTPMASKIQSDLSRSPSLHVYEEPLRRFLAGTTKAVQNGVSLDRVAALIVQALESARLKPRYEIHQNYARDAVLMRMLPARWRERIVSRVLDLGARAS